MENINVKQVKTAEKYAEALFEIAQNQGNVEMVLSDLNLITETLRNSSELRQFINNPVIELNDKKDVLRQLFENHVSQIVTNFVYVICDNSRFEAFPEIYRKYLELIHKKEGIVTVKATSAVEMKDFLKDKLQKKLEQQLSQKVKIEYEINPEIIAGLIVEVNGKTFDNTVVTKIKNIKKQLI